MDDPSASRPDPASPELSGRATPSPPTWEQHELLPGPSVYQWATWGLICLVLIVVAGCGALIRALTTVARTQYIDPITFFFVIVFVLSCVALVTIDQLGRRKKRLELAAGYTTAAQGSYDVERRHSPTGVVVRSAGQGPLTRGQEQEARERVREFLRSRTH
jgi:hypothetical protein